MDSNVGIKGSSPGIGHCLSLLVSIVQTKARGTTQLSKQAKGDREGRDAVLTSSPPRRSSEGRPAELITVSAGTELGFHIYTSV